MEHIRTTFVLFTFREKLQKHIKQCACVPESFTFSRLLCLLCICCSAVDRCRLPLKHAFGELSVKMCYKGLTKSDGSILLDIQYLCALGIIVST